MSEIPAQVRTYPLVRVCHPDCRSHTDCSSPGKRPVHSVEDVRPTAEVRQWLKHGGNYGVVCRSENDLVVWDIDSPEFGEIVASHLPETFTVRSGSGGKHRYYECPGFSTNRDWNTPKGSIRAENWHVVGPNSTHAETGNQYRVIGDREIAEVEPEAIEAVMAEIEDSNGNVQTGGGGGGGSAHSVPASLDFIQRKDYREDVAEILKSDVPHSRRLWMVGFLYSACGLRESEIVDLIMQEANWPELDRETTEKQVASVIKSSNSSRGTHYSEFSDTGDMDPDGSESRKTEESGDGRTLSGGDNNMPEFNDKVAVPVLEGSEDGDSFKKIVLVEGHDGSESFEFLSLKKGRVEEANTTGGETVLVESVQDSVSLGSPDYLDDLIEGLEAMKEQLDD